MAADSKSKKIFDLYVEAGLIDEKATPFKKWEKANERQQKALFELGVERKLFVPEDFEAFSSLWNVKKKDGEPTAQEEVSASVTQVQEDPGTLGTSPLPTDSVAPEVQEEVVQEAQAVPVSAIKSTNPFGVNGPEISVSMPQNVEKDTWIERFAGKNTPILGPLNADFFGDIYRDLFKGYQEGKSIPMTEKLYQQGANISDADLEKYVNAVSAQQTYGVSDEMRQFEKDVEDFGGGPLAYLGAFIKGRGQIAPQLMANSFARMFNPSTAKQALAGGIVAAEGAAVLGQMGPQAFLPEEIVTVPTAFLSGATFMAGLSTEKTMTMQQLINEELEKESLELSVDNLRTVLNNEDNLKSIKRKALRRGVAIGTINAFTKIGSTKAASSLLTKGATRQLGRTGSKLAAGTTSAGLEAAGEGFGEFVGQKAAGQDVEGKEIFLEMIAGTAGAPTSLGLGAYEASKAAKYEVNGGKATRADIFEILDDNDPQTIAAIKVNIENDNALSKLVSDAKQEVKQNAIIKRDVQQAGVTDEADAAKMVELEKEKRKLQGNETTAGKRRVKQLDAEIEAILDKAKPAEKTTPVGEVVNIYEGVDKDGNKRQVEVTTTEEGVVEARLILEEGERSQVVASAKGDISPESVYKGLFDESKPIELVSTQETPATGVDVEAEAQADAEATAEAEAEVDTEASKDLQQMIDDAGMEVTSVETKETVAEEATPETEEVTVVERKVSDNLSIADQDSKDTYYESDQFAEDNIEQDQDSHESMIMERAKKAVNAIKKVAPNVKIVLHRNNNTYSQSTGSSNSRAVYDAGANTIHVNMPRAKGSSIGHEVFHALLREKLGTDSKIQVATANMAKAIGKAINKSKKLTVEQKTELANYINQFNEDTVQNEEALAELLGVLSENYVNLEPAQRGIVRRFIQKIIDLIGIDMDIAGKADADVIDLLNTVSGKVARGQLIEEAEVAGIERAEQRKMNEADINEVILTAYNEGVNTEKTKSDLIDLMVRRKTIREEAKDTEGAAKDQRTIEELSAIDMDQEAPPMEIFFEREIEEQRQKDRDRREMDAYTQAERERSDMIQNDLPSGIFLLLHNQLENKGPKGNAKIHAKDFDTYGDPNYRSSKGGGKRSRRGTGAMQVNRLLTNEGTPSLDAEIEGINEGFGTDLTPQDAIDYIMDRANNPGKYTRENVNLADRIEAEGPDAVLGPVELSAETLADLESMQGQPTPAATEAAPATEAKGKTDQRTQRINTELSKASGTTQVATTTGSYKKVASKIDPDSTVLDYGAGLGLGTDAMSEVLGKDVDSFEINVDRWKGKNKPTYTKAQDINKKYDSIVSLNVVNVVPREVRDFIVQDIFDNLNDNGTAYISSRGFKGDVAGAKNFTKGPEEKSIIIQRRKGGETVDVYQKGFDGKELVDYVQETLGDSAKVESDNTFGNRGVKITKLSERQEAQPGQRTQRVDDVNEKVARIALDNGINRKGFFPRTMNNPQGLRRRLEQFGYGLKETKTKSGYFITKGGTMWNLPYRMRTQEIVPSEVQSKNVAGTKVPKGLSIRSVDGQRVVEGVDNMSVAKVREASPLTFIKNANALRELDLVKGSKKFRPLPIPKSEKALRLMSPAKRRALLKRADEIYDTFVKQVSDNLVFIHDLYGDEFREISTLWYDGANQIAQGLAEKHNVSLEQVSGILASLSPQKDWYQNVRLAELVLEQYDTNPVFTQEALDFQKEINERGLKAALKKGKGRLTEKGKKNKADAEQLIIELEGLIGKRLKDVEPKYQPYVLRTTQEITGQKDYQIVSPDGERVGIAKKNDGTNAKVAWGSYVEIGKAVAIYLNGSPESISTQLGTAHKIRNFYDNIVDPMSEEGEVTMDTHAVAAATLLPLSGNSVEVAQNFGQGPVSSSNAAGVSGLYYAYADAYADAAKRTGLLPRQMQSVTWEAVRGLFTDSFKNSKKNVNDVRNIFSNYAQGKISIDEARKQAVDRAGGIQDPSWAGSLLSDVTRDIEAESDIRGVRRDERSDERSRTERGREGDSKGDVRSQRDGIRTQQLPKRANAADVVNFGKRNNFTLSQIQDYLVNTMGLAVKDAKRITEAELGPFNEIPASFLDVGINDGFKLFDRLKKYVDKLKKDNVPVMKRLEMVQDFLEKQPEYIEQADKNRKAPSTTQAKMMVDVKDALGLKAKRNMAQRMRDLKKAIRNREKGARDLQQIKRKLRNFMRETLPRDVYTRKDVLDMVRKISDVNKINLDRMIGEVESFVTEKQVAYLESEIDNILNGKYEVTANGRRKGVKIDSETADRIANIRDNLIVGPEATAKDVVEQNEKLNKRIGELSRELNPTEEQSNEIVDLLAAMAINESKLSENNNPIKVTQLERANQILSETLDGGKQTFKNQIKKAHEKYKSEFVKVYKAITGIELDPNSENYKKEAQEAQGRMDRLAQEKELDKGMKKYINTTIRGIKTFLRYGESLEGLMDIISEAPGALIEALPDELVYEKINDSSRTYKKRQLQNQKVLTAKIKETFGKKWKKAMKRGTIKKNTHIYKNVERAKKAQEKYDRNRTIANYYNLKKVLGEERIKMSANEIAYFYQQYQDPANIPSFANPDNIYFGPDHANIMKQMVEGVAIDPVTGKKVPIKERGIDQRLLDFSNWMVEDFFPSRYDDYNATYKDIYRTNMPWNQYYAGRIYRENKTYSALDLLGNDAVKNGVVNAASTKDRRANSEAIKRQDMFNNLYTYLEDMEWFAAYGSQLRDINKLFSNPLIRRSITSLRNGKATLDMIDHSIKNVAARGIQSGKTNDFVNWINKGFINAKLGLSPTIALKQMLSAPTYANDIGYTNYLKYMFKDKASMLKNFNEIRKNSVYVQDRVTDDFRRKIEAFSGDQVVDAIPRATKNYFANALMVFGRMGDIGAIFLGGMPNYAYYKDQYKKRNPQATEQEVIDYAIRKFERDTKSTQQSMDLQDRDYFQSSNSLMRSLNMFLTTPKQYFRKELSGLRKMRRGMRDMYLAYKAKKAGVGDTKQIRQSGEQVVDGFRQFVQYHVFMPLAFQYVTIGLPGIFRDRREGDEDDLKRAILLGNINALFIIGDLVMGAADMYQNKSYAGNQTGLVPYSRMNRLANLYKWAQMSSPDSGKRDKWMNKFYLELAEVFLRLPVGNMHRFYENIKKLDSVEDPREVALRLMNFSDYIIEGPGDSFGSGKSSNSGSGKSSGSSKPTTGIQSTGGIQKAK